MSESPDKINRKILSRATIAGTVLAIGGVVIFLLLWILLGNAGVDQFPRLIISICVPPALISTLLGVWFLLARPSNQDAGQ